jgi:hydroxyacylglutathione hydrolase
VLIAGFPAGSFQANCYVLAVGPGSECLVVDPGENAVEPLREVLRTRDLMPAAVLLTHGHLDHIASAAEICRAAQIPAFLHAGDEHLLDYPLSGLNDVFRQMLQGFPLDDLRPADVRTLGTELDAAGLQLAVDHTPGHTPGSVVFRFQAAGASGDERPEVLLTGDTLFAGSVGRTDLPGGSWDVLMESLRSKLLTRPDDAVILPGHGPSSTIGAERIGNPFLAA